MDKMRKVRLRRFKHVKRKYMNTSMWRYDMLAMNGYKKVEIGQQSSHSLASFLS